MRYLVLLLTVVLLITSAGSPFSVTGQLRVYGDGFYPTAQFGSTFLSGAPAYSDGSSNWHIFNYPSIASDKTWTWFSSYGTLGDVATSDGAGGFTWSAPGGGIGGSGTDNRVVRWDGTSSIQDSGWALEDSDNLVLDTGTTLVSLLPTGGVITEGVGVGGFFAGIYGEAVPRGSYSGSIEMSDGTNPYDVQLARAAANRWGIGAGDAFTIPGQAGDHSSTTNGTFSYNTTTNKFRVYENGAWADVVNSSGAPTNATYITQTSDATLTNEQALSALASGYVKNTTGTGVLSTVATVPHTDISGGTSTNIAYFDGSGLLAHSNDFFFNYTATNLFAGIKNGSTSGGRWRWYEDSDNGTNYTGWEAPGNLTTSWYNLFPTILTSGIWAQDSATRQITQRTLTAPAAGLTISNATGASGDPTFALANDLSALEGLGSTGLATRTAADTWAQRSIAFSNSATTDFTTSVTNPAGVAGNPTINFALNSQVQSFKIDACAQGATFTAGGLGGGYKFGNTGALDTLTYYVYLPDNFTGSTFTITCYGFSTNFGASANAYFTAAGSAHADGSGGLITGTAQNVTTNMSATLGAFAIEYFTFPAITLDGTPTAGEAVRFSIARDSGNAADTYGGDFFLSQIKVEYNVSTITQ